MQSCCLNVKNMWICSGLGADILSLCKSAEGTYSTNLQEHFFKRKLDSFLLISSFVALQASASLKKISSSLSYYVTGEIYI
jgi:hypothetical protein